MILIRAFAYRFIMRRPGSKSKLERDVAQPITPDPCHSDPERATINQRLSPVARFFLFPWNVARLLARACTFLSLLRGWTEYGGLSSGFSREMHSDFKRLRRRYDYNVIEMSTELEQRNG